MDSFQDHLRFLQEKAVNARCDIVQMLSKAGSGHLGGSLSCVEMLVALYYGTLSHGSVMRYDVSKPGWDGQDYCVLSKGHASPTLYSILADVGFFPKEELASFRHVNSLLQAFPHKKIPGVVLDSGIAGQGVQSSLGLAMALKMDRRENHVYCLVGDGELQSGTIWEAALIAAHYRLDNLTLLIDYNTLQMDGLVRGIVGIDSVADKFEAFGWKSIPVSDGHNFHDLLLGLEKALETQRRPSVLVCRTIKGKGVPFAENKASYHAEVLSEQELEEALRN